MNRLIVGLTAVVLAACASGWSAAGDKLDAGTILDKGIKALGGTDKLGAIKAVTWKSKGKINFGGNESEFTQQVTVQGLDHVRSEFEGDFGGNKIVGVTVLKGDKGWRKFADNNMELDEAAVANEKRNLYLQMTPMTLAPLKGKGFKVETAGEEQIGGKAAMALKATGPDGKHFTIYFDKDSGRPVKQVAKVIGFMGEEFTQETTFANYKEFGGVHKATKIASKRDGEDFIALEITEFRVLDKVDPKTFAAPE